MTTLPAADHVAALRFQLKALGLPIGDREVAFAKESGRRFRFDLAWHEHRLALEVDGGSWVGGRHVSGVGFERDCQKVSEAACLGWRLIRVTPAMIVSGQALEYVERALRWRA